MKHYALFILCFISFKLIAQTIFEDNFESYSNGTDLTTEGYELSDEANYDVNLSAKVTAESGHQFARFKGTPNGGANMQIATTFDVEGHTVYNYAIESRGPFKRQIRVYDEAGHLLASSEDYKPSSEAEKSAWKKMEISFLSGENDTKIKIGFYHYWSGTIDLDNIVVNKQASPATQTSYYISSSEGNDDHAGTLSSPWKSLDKINNAFLFPGDTILFKRGDRFNGHFVINGSGNSDKPILITAYGEGEKPIITGQVGAEAGGDYEEAILVENQDNLIFDGLDVQNERMVTRNGVSDFDAYGIYVLNSGTKVMRNLLFQNMTFQNVYAPIPRLAPEDFDKIQVTGLAFHSTRNNTVGKEKNIDGIEVKDSYFTDLQRLGIKFSHSGGNTGIGNDSINRNMNISIHNNEFYYLGGTGVLPNGTYNCLIEHNIFDHPGATTDSRMPGRGSSIWNYKAMNTIMQYNMCLSTRGYLDSYGIHIDKHNTSTFVQYNYMDDCIGGFVEILADNKDAVYRFNVSVNSGFRYSNGVSNWKAGSSTIYIYSDRWTDPNQAGLMLSDGVYVYNNTVVMDSTFETTFNVDAKNMFIYNNIFSSTNGAKMGYLQAAVRDNNTPFNMTNNLYEGNVNPAWIAFDKKPIHGASEFTGAGEDKWAYELKSSSDAINAGVAITGPKVPGAGYGVFKNISPYPNVDLYGNPVDLSSGTPNIGACNEKIGVATKGILRENAAWLVFADSNMQNLNILCQQDIAGSAMVTLTNIKGQTLQSENRYFQTGETTSIPLPASIHNGIYILTIAGEGFEHSRSMVLYK